MQTITEATARWDTESDPANPGWVIDVEFADGLTCTRQAAPSVYHESEDADPERIVAETIAYEGWHDARTT